jgi:hypothetical protein
MVVSSAMRIGTQDLMFRTGMVSPPGGAEREIEGGAKGTKTETEPKPTGGGNGKGTGKSTTVPKGGAGSNGNGKGTGNGKQPTGKRPSSGKSAGNGKGSNGSSEDEVTPAAKPHPRSRPKKERKAR